jgi:hypothetical protein
LKLNLKRVYRRFAFAVDANAHSAKTQHDQRAATGVSGGLKARKDGR